MTEVGGGFSGVLGQEAATQTLVRALERGQVHHAYRFEGPDGVGKEKAGFALAQSLVCEGPGPLACLECGACRRAGALSENDPRVPLHPDVVLVQRGLYPPNVLGTSRKETTGIGVDQVRRIVIGRVGLASHEGKALVFIVRDADELTIQAANALLKVLEEPPPRTHFILLTSRPQRLLDTIRSRTLAVRFGPLADPIVADLLRSRGHDPSIARLAGGSVSTGLALAAPEVLAAREAFARRVDEAVGAGDLAPSLALAAEAKDRTALRTDLSHLAHSLALRARDAAGDDPSGSARSARQHGEVTSALTSLEMNGQPGLILESLLARMRRA